MSLISLLRAHKTCTLYAYTHKDTNPYTHVNTIQTSLHIHKWSLLADSFDTDDVVVVFVVSSTTGV